MLVYLFLVFSFLTQASGIPKFEGVSPGYDVVCGHTSSEINCWGLTGTFAPVGPNVGGFSNLRQLEIDYYSMCALDDLGLICWGSSHVPVLPPEIAHSDEISSFSFEGHDLCAVIKGQLICTGPSAKYVPSGLKLVTKVFQEFTMSCAIHEEGKLACWKTSNTDNTYGLFNIPKELGHVVDVSLSDNGACVINDQSEVICWGDRFGAAEVRHKFSFIPIQVGISGKRYCVLGKEGEVLCQNGVNPVAHLGKITQLTNNSGYSFCASNEKKEFHCWGGYLPELPIVINNPKMMTASSRSTYFLENDKIVGTRPYGLGPLEGKNITYMAVGSNDLCFIDENGLHCAGDLAAAPIPPDVKDAVAVAVGNKNACGIVKNGEIKCWNVEGGSKISPPTELHAVEKLIATSTSYCSLDVNFKVNCWGNLENPEFTSSAKVLDIAQTGNSACALLDDQTIECWYEKSQYAHYEFPPITTIGMKGIVGGWHIVCAYGESAVQCFGKDYFNNLGAPKIVGKIRSITAGYSHVCLQDDEKVKCWGNNYDGQYQFFQEKPKLSCY